MPSRNLNFKEWTELAASHQLNVGPLADAFIKRRQIGKTHAVHDFLFTYYGCSTSKLKQWIPSIYEKIEIPPNSRELYPWLIDHWFMEEEGYLFLNRERLHEGTRTLAKFVAELCRNVLNKPARFGCFGLHEWAMVYKVSEDEIRHKGQGLRMSPSELTKFVESQPICCSHYDAFRFFTKDAKPFNTLNPVLETRAQMEQGGCVHANMDLYKWSTKLWPWIGSDFIAKTFFIALEGRELDMRASPYDLEASGYPPIKIETEAGKRQYQKEQQQLTEKSNLLRYELQHFCERLSVL